MTPKTYNLGSYVAGDTVSARTFTLTRTANGTTNDEPLTGATVKIDLISSTGKIVKQFRTGDGLSVAGNVISWAEFSCPDVPGRYKYDLELTYPGGVKKTYIRGQLRSIEGSTQ